MAEHGRYLRMIWSILIAMALIAACAAGVYAIGISPTDKKVQFEAGKHVEFPVRVINDQAKDMKALIYARGELAQYVSLKQTVLSISSTEPMKTFQVMMDLPDAVGKPGNHDVDIVVVEYPAGFGEEGESEVIKAVGSVIIKVSVQVPYPDKYLDAQLQISQADKGQDVAFTMPVFNLGTQPIESMKAKITIYGPTYEELGTASSEEASLGAGQSGKLVARWNAQTNPGMYHAVAQIDYDGKQAIVESNFEIGLMLVEVTDINVTSFKLGSVAKLELLLSNRWNQPIPDVYADVTIRDSSKVFATYKTATTDLEPRGDGKITSYWDTTGSGVGQYFIDVVLHYKGMAVPQYFTADVGLDTVSFRTGTSGEVVQGSGKGLGGNTAIVLLVIVLIAVNIGWFVFVLKKLKDKGKKK